MPRPTGPTTANDLKMTSVRMSESKWHKMKRLAHASGIYGSEALDEAIDDWNAKHEKVQSNGKPAPPKRGRKPVSTVGK